MSKNTKNIMPNIGITEKNLGAVAESLTLVLANEVALYTKLRKFHWNVAGESFMEFHKLFETHYKITENYIDEVAERIGKLGAQVVGTLHEFEKLASIKEHPGKFPSSKEMLTELLSDHESIIIELRKMVTQCANKLNDAGTADFLTGLMESHETNSWVLRRYLN